MLISGPTPDDAVVIDGCCICQVLPDRAWPYWACWSATIAPRAGAWPRPAGPGPWSRRSRDQDASASSTRASPWRRPGGRCPRAPGRRFDS